MGIPIQVKRGTKAKIDALALSRGLLEGEPLFITDLNKFAVATSSTAYQIFRKEETIAFDVRTNVNNSSASMKLTWNQVNFNTGDYSTANHQFVASVAGIYNFQASILIDTAAIANGYIIGLAKNDSIITGLNGPAANYRYKAAGTYISVDITQTMSLVVGDIVSVKCEFGNANVMYVTSPDCYRYNKFCGHLVGRI